MVSSPSSIAQPAVPSRRVRVLDEARGLAMVLVCLSHFVDTWLSANGERGAILRDRVVMVTRMASPCFILISGLLLGVLFHLRGDRPGLKDRFVDRGIFLLTAGHLLIAPACWFFAGGLSAFTRMFFITDTIGLALLLGPWVVTRIRPGQRLVLAASLYVAGWSLSLAWGPPHPSAWEAVIEALVGVRHPTFFLYVFPIVPWLALYLAASAGAEWLLRATSGAGRRPHGTLARVAGLLVATGAAMACLRLLVLRNGMGASRWLGLLALSQKSPPGPVYLLFYCGCAFGGLGLLFVAERRGALVWIRDQAARIGRHSLFVFILQYYIFYLVIWVLRLPLEPWVPLVFVGALVGISLAVVSWGALERQSLPHRGLPLDLEA